jgi:hypothetical protein
LSALNIVREVLYEQALDGVDMVLLKLCYADFTESTDAASLAREYAGTLGKLQSRHPATHFIAVTAPLTTVQTGPKAWIKRMLGKTPYGVAESARRHEFNELLRARFPEPALFDLRFLAATRVQPDT